MESKRTYYDDNSHLLAFNSSADKTKICENVSSTDYKSSLELVKHRNVSHWELMLQKQRPIGLRSLGDKK